MALVAERPPDVEGGTPAGVVTFENALAIARMFSRKHGVPYFIGRFPLTLDFTRNPENPNPPTHLIFSPEGLVRKKIGLADERLLLAILPDGEEVTDFHAIFPPEAETTQTDMTQDDRTAEACKPKFGAANLTGEPSIPDSPGAGMAVGGATTAPVPVGDTPGTPGSPRPRRARKTPPSASLDIFAGQELAAEAMTADETTSALSATYSEQALPEQALPEQALGEQSPDVHDSGIAAESNVGVGTDGRAIDKNTGEVLEGEQGLDGVPLENSALLTLSQGQPEGMAGHSAFRPGEMEEVPELDDFQNEGEDPFET